VVCERDLAILINVSMERSFVSLALRFGRFTAVLAAITFSMLSLSTDLIRGDFVTRIASVIKNSDGEETVRNRAASSCFLVGSTFLVGSHNALDTTASALVCASDWLFLTPETLAVGTGET
jgi:hypothetical protein